MRIRAVGACGLLAAVLALPAACGRDDAPRTAAAADGAVPSYVPPHGAPDFCVGLASADELRQLPTSVGTLVAGADVVEARIQIGRTVGQVRAVLDDVRADGGADDLATALDDLVTALAAAVDGPVTDPIRQALTDRLERVGAAAQPACGFPS